MTHPADLSGAVHLGSDVANHPGLRRVGAQHLAEWEDSLWHAVQYGRDSLADLPVRAQKASRRSCPPRACDWL
jgi:hypothetical protein